MLTRFLDWLDEAAGGLIRVAYLLAGITAVAVYFGAGHLPGALDATLNAVLPWALAFALETHTYLTARRVRAAWQDHERRALRVNLVVLVGLVAFSAWNQLGYLYGTWQPPTHTPLALPIWLAYLVRALVVPTAFLAAAFLAPLAEPVAIQIENEARATLADVFKIAKRQRRRMLAEAERAGRDMTGALVDLVPDDELRHIISHAYAAIRDDKEPPPTISAVDVAPITLPNTARPSDGHPTALQDGAGDAANEDVAVSVASAPTPAADPLATPAAPAAQPFADVSAGAGDEPPDEPPPSPEPPTPRPPRRRVREAASAAQASHNGHSRVTALGTLTPLRPEPPETSAPDGFPANATTARRGKRQAAAANARQSSAERRRKALEASAFALLDDDPALTKEALRKALKCRQTTADSLYTAWGYARRRLRATQQG